MAESFYLFSNGELRRKDNVLRMTAPDGNFKDILVEMARDIFLFGEVNLNTKCLNYAGKLSIPLHVFDYYGNYTGSFYPRETNISGRLLVEQVNHYTDSAKRLAIAKDFIEAASSNILRNLRYYNERDRNLDGHMDEIRSLRGHIGAAKDIQELMGTEGSIRRVYYSGWNIIVNQDIAFEGRVKNPPNNMINTLISFVNSLVYATCLSEIYSTQLHPAVSYLHSVGERRFSLCLDISEVFKPLIADRLIFSLLNKNILTAKDFESGSNNCYLKDGGRKRLLMEYDESLGRTIRHKDLKRDVSYRYLIRLECYKLIKHLMGDKQYEGFTIWW